jgi:hypothetical protein
LTAVVLVKTARTTTTTTITITITFVEDVMGLVMGSVLVGLVAAVQQGLEVAQVRARATPAKLTRKRR